MRGVGFFMPCNLSSDSQVSRGTGFNPHRIRNEIREGSCDFLGSHAMWLRIANRVEVTVSLKGKRVSGPAPVFQIRTHTALFIC
jgi:hypothetical protein